MSFDEDILDYINNNILGFDHSLLEFLDHTAILAWINLIAHSANIGKEAVNIGGRPWVRLPSGRKIRISIKIEEVK